MIIGGVTEQSLKFFIKSVNTSRDLPKARVLFLISPANWEMRAFLISWVKRGTCLLLRGVMHCLINSVFAAVYSKLTATYDYNNDRKNPWSKVASTTKTSAFTPFLFSGKTVTLESLSFFAFVSIIFCYFAIGIWGRGLSSIVINSLIII